MSDIDRRLKRIEERLGRLDPPPRFGSLEEYVAWRDSHGGGMAAAMVLAAGRSALKRLKGDVRPDEVEELWRLVMNAVRVEARLNRARARQPRRDDGLARAR